QVQRHPLGGIVREERVVGPDLLDEAAIAGSPLIGHNDAVKGPFLGAAARQPDLHCHCLRPSSLSIEYATSASGCGGHPAARTGRLSLLALSDPRQPGKPA